MTLDQTFRFLDLDAETELHGIEAFFPAWNAGEHVAFFSPHDDDAMLGAGYLMLAAQAAGAVAHLVIFHRGNAGYSKPTDKETIVEVRKKETVASYRGLGISQNNILRLDLPDFSGNAYLGMFKPVQPGQDQSTGTFERLLVFLRKSKVSRLVFANGFREHIDHAAVAQSAILYGPQAGDPVVVDWAEPWTIQSFIEYSVWGNFDPVESIRRSAEKNHLPANRAIIANEAAEQKIQSALQQFHSQQAIIKGILENRKERKIDQGYLELYMQVDPRPKLDYNPYKQSINHILKKKK
nr:PIG-L family deacetylase [Candidatus Sigynarchaeota archaeon]